MSICLNTILKLNKLASLNIYFIPSNGPKSHLEVFPKHTLQLTSKLVVKFNTNTKAVYKHCVFHEMVHMGPNNKTAFGTN